MKAVEVIDKLKCRFPNEPEYIQAVEEVLSTIEDVYNEHPEFERYNLIERLCIPDRVFTFRISWVDDKGNVQNNMGYRVQHNNAIGPYKGGIRFHSSVNLSILKFLAFEQTFKNSLTTLAMGGGKGGSDFSPRGKSDMEVMRFCQAFIAELWRHIGPDTDVPAGDIGVGGREVGYMYGMYKKMAREFTGTFTGKGREFGGSLVRPEATGYGNVYFLLNMLATKGIDIKDKKVAISGSGNVATYTAKKLLELGAKVVSMSDSNGSIYVPEGISQEQLDYIFKLKNIYRGRIREFAEEYDCQYFDGERPWQHVKCDIAMPSATQNELDEIEKMEAMEKNLNLSANTVKTQTQLKKHEVRNLLIIKTLLEGKELEGDVMKWFESTSTLKSVRKARTTITFHDGDDLLAIMDEHPNKAYKDLKKALEDQGFHLDGHTVRK